MKRGHKLGPYLIEEPLGSGGMATLHHARHLETGQRVALKTVEHAVRTNLRSLRREIRALQALDHPNVVRIADADTDSAPPWYAMELIDGLPLHKHWMVTPLEKRWRTYLRAFADICDGLSFVHGLGLVHRDLKPANVVLRASHRTYGEAVVVDFGLATVSAAGSGREQIYKRSEVIGTPQYISPEQVKQQHVDARTDLYSLGCMLYESVVGRTPFPADVPFAAFVRHVSEPPEIPRDALDRVPSALAELIHALLEKEPRNRPAYANDVRATLATLGEVSSPVSKPQARTYLHRPEFVGREALAPAYEQIATETARGDGGLVVIRGPAGSGKSRVAIELIREVHFAADEHLEVLIAQSPNSATSAPFASLRAVFDELADICTDRGPHFAAHLMGQDATFLVRHLPVVGAVPGVELGDASTLNPDLLESATLDAATAIIERMAAEKPLVIALDDVQWCDPLTRLWLERVQRQRPWDRVPLQLLLISRADESGELLSTSLIDEATHVLEVGPLTDDALAAMVESMTGVAKIPPEFFAALRVDAHGLPSRAAQWLSAAVSRGALVRDFGRWRFEGVPIENADIHDTVTTNLTFDDLLETRLRMLKAQHRAVVDLAAVLGPEIRAEVLAHLGETELRMVDELITDGVLVERGRGAVAFATPELFEVARSGLGERPRTELHVRAAAMLEAVRAPIVEIAHHLALSGWRDEARFRLFQAADDAFDAGEWVEAERLYHTLADLGFKTPEREVTGWSRIAILGWRHGEYDDARDAMAAAERSCNAGVDGNARAEMARAAGLLARAKDPERSLQRLSEARDLFAQHGEWLDERNVAIEVGNAHCRAAQFEAGRKCFMEVHDRARELNDVEGVATALASVGATWISSRRYDVAADFLERAAMMFREQNAPHRLSDALFNMGVCLVDQGRTESAIEVFEEVSQLRATSGDQRGGAVAESARAHALIVAGRYEDALQDVERAIATLSRSEDRYPLAIAHGYAGQAHSHLRHYTPAMDHFVQALTLHARTQNSPMEPYVHVDIAQLERRLGMYEEARMQLDKASSFESEDALLDVVLRVQRALLDLATRGETSADVSPLKRALTRMQLPATSEAAQQVARLERSLKARVSERLHGELLQHLPPAFREG